MFKNIVKWFRYSPPLFSTIEDYQNWKYTFKTNAPVRWFFTTVLPKPFSYIAHYIDDNIRNWIIRYNIVKVNLPYGFYSKEYLMLHIPFSLLTDYVECTLSKIMLCSNRTNIKPPTASKFIPYYFETCWRNKELGMKYLNWESELDNKNSPTYSDNNQHIPEDGKMNQSEAAREICELYLWWTEVRPNRKEVKYYNNGLLQSVSDICNQYTSSQAQDLKQWLDSKRAQEDEWENEDSNMLIRVVKIRKHLLW